MKCDNKCKYFDEEDGCTYPYLGDGIPKHAPCFRSTADVVEVIRCEHCLHWDDEIKDGVYVGNLYHCCDYDGEHKRPDHFCSYAERREDAN